MGEVVRVRANCYEWGFFCAAGKRYRGERGSLHASREGPKKRERKRGRGKNEGICKLMLFGMDGGRLRAGQVAAL